MTRRANVVAVLLAATAALTSFPAVAGTLEDGFANPPAQARPRFRWWWPGAAVTDEELRRELRLMADNGFGGAEIQSFLPNFITLTPEEKAVVNDYAEPGFFAHVRAAGHEAKALGLDLDYTLGSAWPSGGGTAVPPEKALTELTMACTAITGGVTGPIKIDIPKRTRRFGALNFLDARVKAPEFADWGKRLDARARIVAVVAMKGSAPTLRSGGARAMGFALTPWSDVTTSGMLDPSTRLVLTDRLREDGTLDWAPPPGDWQVFVLKQYAADMSVLGAAGRGPQLILDHMDAKAFAAHAARVGDPMGKHPDRIRATFVDSLELMQDIPWGARFLEEFRKRRGYDLTPYLPFVLQPGWMQAWYEHWSPPYFNAAGGDLAERVRTDYRRTVSDLMISGFVTPFVAWNHAHGMKAKFQAHGGAFDIIQGYGLADIPETEDLVHGGDPLFMRLARSGAHLYGRPLVSAESLVWKERAYKVTPDDIRRRVDLLISGGVNTMILHGMNYRFHADNWPGWHAFAPSPFDGGFSSMLNETNPVWPAVKPLAAYIGRLQSVMQAGDAVVPVAYFYGQTGYYVGIEDQGAGKQAAEKAFIAGGYDFDRINPDSISAAKVVGRQLVARSGQLYPVLVLPPLDAISADTAERIAAFAKAGLPVFFTDHAPNHDEGLFDAEGRDARVRSAMAAARAAGARVVPADDLIQGLRTANVPANLTFVGDASNLVYVQRKVGGRLVTFVHNGGRDAREVTLVLPQAGSLARWNAMDGSVTPVSATSSGRETRTALALAPGESALLVLDSKQLPAVNVPVARLIGRIVVPQDGWALSVEGHVMRKPFGRDFGTVALGDWSQTLALAGFAGNATYRRTLEVDTTWLTVGMKVMLDLGQVNDMATVSVNGHALPPVISAPYRVDITNVLKAGRNNLDVVVANVPHNAMIDPSDPSLKKLKPVAAGWTGPIVIEATSTLGADQGGGREN